MSAPELSSAELATVEKFGLNKPAGAMPSVIQNPGVHRSMDWKRGWNAAVKAMGEIDANDAWRATAEVILERIKVQDQPALDFIAKVVALAPLPVVVSDSTNPTRPTTEGGVWGSYVEYLKRFEEFASCPLSDSTALIEEMQALASDLGAGTDFARGQQNVAQRVLELIAALHPLGVADSTSEGENKNG